MAGSKPPRRALLALTLLLAAPLIAQESRSPSSKPKETYSGSAVFKTYCTSCHGLSAKGDGPLADHLRIRPPDLTLFARRNDGKWEAAAH